MADIDNNNTKVVTPAKDSIKEDSKIDISMLQIKEETIQDGKGDLLEEMINDDFAIDLESIASAMDDEEEQIDTKAKTKVEVKEEIQDQIQIQKAAGSIKQEVMNQTYKEMEEKLKNMKKDPHIVDYHQKRQEQLKLMSERKLFDKWGKALMHYGVEPRHFANKDIIMKIFPFSEFNFIKAKKGEFERKKMSQVVLELVKFEVINDTYNVE